MTSRKLAEMALEQMQTIALLGDDPRCCKMAVRVLGLISKNGPSIPDESAWHVLGEGPCMLTIPPEEESK